MRKLDYNEIFRQRTSEKELQNLKRTPVVCVVENIRSMHNVGSIFRSSDGARVEQLILAGFTAQPPRKEIEKTALGATETVPWCYHKDPLPAVKEFKARGYTVVALEHTTNSTNYSDARYDFPICLLLGNEVDGVSDTLLAEADMAVEIPMLGIKHSLNVSVAYAIIVYDMLAKYL